MTNPEQATPDQPAYKYIGTRPIRPDGLDKVTGRARFAADLSLPGMLAGHVLRSPHAHARIVSIDTSAAEAIPGVKAVVSGSDFPDLDPADPQYNVSRNLMARDKVLYEGQVVAAVAASSRGVAQQATEAIAIEYEVLPHVMTVDEAMADGAPLLHADLLTQNVEPEPTEASNVARRTVLERGDVEAGFAEADVVVEREFTTKPVHQGYIEPHAVVADTSQDDTSVVWCSTQGHFRVQSQTASMLGWEPSQIKVLPAEIGGGFGGKTTIYLEPLAVLLSRKANRPVKLVMSRDEVFRATGPTPFARSRYWMSSMEAGPIFPLYSHLRSTASNFPAGTVTS